MPFRRQLPALFHETLPFHFSDQAEAFLFRFLSRFRLQSRPFSLGGLSPLFRLATQLLLPSLFSLRLPPLFGETLLFRLRDQTETFLFRLLSRFLFPSQPFPLGRLARLFFLPTQLFLASSFFLRLPPLVRET